ncbi:MAG: hypothetical protein MI717_08065 [Spirochaetales bacterium]|nr:hypothetical protein [Spirochaetales bacterium]
MRTIVVTVCSGTACYILGGSDLLTLRDHLEEPYSRHVMLAGSPCLNRCKDRSENKRPPYVTVDGKVYGNMTLETLVKTVQSVLDAS